MQHQKRYFESCLNKNGANIKIKGPVATDVLARCRMHEGLIAFRPPSDQHAALINISELPEARVIIASEGDLIIGYITFLHPDPLERWSDIPMDDLLELGAIEVAPPYRNLGLGKEMLRLSFMDDAMEDYIVISTEYYWHWDLQGSGLSVWEYRKVMEKIMNSAGLIWYATDDPEICAHPANCLMVRIGKRVPASSIERFDKMRFTRRFMY